MWEWQMKQSWRRRKASENNTPQTQGNTQRATPPTDLNGRKQHGGACSIVAASVHDAGQAAGVEQHTHGLVAGRIAK
jgi:hypothetical protein